MNGSPDPSAPRDRAITRLLLVLTALGTSLMLLGGALVPSAEDEAPPVLDLVSVSIDRLIGLVGG